MSRVVTKDLLQADLTTAMKGRDHARISTLRFLLAAVKNKEIEVGRLLNTDELISVIASGIKKGHEAIAGFEQGGRQDRAQNERDEITILQSYLPPPLSDQELETLIDEAVRETGAEGARDVGAVMKWVMPRVTGRADGRMISQKVKERLS